MFVDYKIRLQCSKLYLNVNGADVNLGTDIIVSVDFTSNAVD